MNRLTHAKTCRVKGSSLAVRVTWVRLYHGERGLETLGAQVGDELSEILTRGIDMAQWYPLDRYIELNTAIDSLYGAGDLALVRALGRYAAEANLTTVFRMLYKAGSVQWILAQSARLWSLHYDSGQLLVREFHDGQIEIEIADFATPSRVHCLSVQGWIERAAELIANCDVTVREVDCRANGQMRCRFRIDLQ